MKGLKRGVEAELTRTLTPQLSSQDAVIRDAMNSLEEVQAGFCPMCDLEAFLYAPPSEVIIGSLQSGMTTAASRPTKGKHFCTLCEISVNPDARGVAIYAGFIWYLIGKPDSEDQSAINRTLWLSANQTWAGYQEASRAALRATLATQPPERGFNQVSAVLRGAEKASAEVAITDIIGIHGFGRADQNKRRALMGTIGMHEVLCRVEEGEARPDWLGQERYFLTGAGLKRLSQEAHALLIPGSDPTGRFPLGRPGPGEHWQGPRKRF